MGQLFLDERHLSGSVSDSVSFELTEFESSGLNSVSKAYGGSVLDVYGNRFSRKRLHECEWI